MGLEITDVRIRYVDAPDNEILKAYASIEINGCLLVHNLKVIEGERGLFVAMPARRSKNGEFADIVHPINAAFRDELESVILAAYRGDDWGPPEGAGARAPIWPPPIDLFGRLARELPGMGPAGAAGAV